MAIKILIYAHDLGGAKAIGEVIERLRSGGASAMEHTAIFADGLARKYWKQCGFETKKFPGRSGLDRAIRRSDVVFTGTSCPAAAEPLLWRMARDSGKPSVALLDFWTHYIERFVEADSRRIIWPDKILVMDEASKNGLIDAGAPPGRVEITGQPFLESRIRYFSGKRLPAARESGRLNIMFVSQPLHKMPNAKKWGYDEFKAAACAVKALNSLVELDGLKPNLIIRPHPKEDKKDLKKHLDSCDIQFKWSFDKAPDPDVTISKCRFIFGMSSMLLIEAALANRAVASVQPGLASEDPFVFSRWGYCELIKDAGHLRRYILKKIADGAKTTAVSKRFIRGNMNSSGRVARLLLSYEKRN